MFSNCGTGEDSWESLEQHGDQTSQWQRKSTLNIHWKDWCWSSNTWAIWCKELTHWKRPWCWERLRSGGEGGDRAWDGWMASLTQWTWIHEQAPGDSERQGSLECPVHGVTKSQTWLSSQAFVVQLLSHIQLFETPWSAAHHASVSFTISQSLLKLMSIELVMPSNHLMLSYPLLFLPSIFPSIRVFSNELALCIRWPKYWSFSFSISLSKEYSGLISFRIDLFDLALQGTSPTPQLKSSSSSVLGFLYGPTLTFIHDHLKNHYKQRVLLGCL